MGCFWVVLIILIALAIVLGIRAFRKRVTPAPNGDKPHDMTLFVRDLLGCYLVLLAIFLSYTIYRLLAVEFPPDSTPIVQQAPPAATPNGNSSPANGTSNAGQTPSPTPAFIVPTIAKVAPSTINYTDQPPSITVSGNNFSSQSKVRINGASLTTELAPSGELHAKLDKQLSPGTVYIDVVNGDAFSNSLALTVVSYGKLFWCRQTFDIGPDARLVLLVLLAGALGSFIHALQSLVDFSGNATLKASWAWWYIARPFIGMALALVFYSALRGGLVAGTPSSVKDVNPYGIFTIGALAGMFSDKATQKLADIFDVLFKSDDNRKDKLKKVAIKTTSLPAGKLNTDYPAFQLEALDGAPPYAWTSDLPQDLGLTLTSAGILSGRALKQTAGATIKVTVKDSSGDSDTKNLTLTINA